MAFRPVIYRDGVAYPAHRVSQTPTKLRRGIRRAKDLIYRLRKETECDGCREKYRNFLEEISWVVRELEEQAGLDSKA